MIRSALLALAVALAAPTIAHAGTSIAVGVAEGASVDATAAAVEAVTGGEVDRRLEDLGALVVEVDDPGAAVEAVASLPGVGYAERVGTRRLAFEPNDPLAFFQWYLRAIRAFEFWDVPPAIGPVRVAVIDSGIDGTHPEFQGRIAAAKTFVGGNPRRDELGHGTAVAGEIAASIDNAEGIAGVGLGVELLVAKVVDPRTNAIEIDDEAAAIRWAIENEAQVINLSLGGPRDPRDRFANVPDTFSNVERAAIDYAYENGAVVVAATGNTQPGPYPYASYPAALPHVLGVSAIDQSGKTPAFSNRDAVYNDLAAPGAGIVSTFPVELTDASCGWPGYNICARGPYAAGNGTSFSAPLASATAALLLGTRPQLLPSQVLAILELSAEPAGPAGRDPTTGNGVLDVAAALA